MDHVKCPNCGCDIILSKKRRGVDLHQVFHVAQAVERRDGKITTEAVAARIYLSEAQTRRVLNQLEAAEMLTRYGERSGWFINEETCA